VSVLFYKPLNKLSKLLRVLPRLPNALLRLPRPSLPDAPDKLLVALERLLREPPRLVVKLSKPLNVLKFKFNYFIL
jgi:hypothetical protein